MKTIKAIILPVLGLLSVLAFIVLAYATNHVFLDKLLICGFILTMVFMARMRDIIKQNTSHAKNACATK